MGAPSVLWDESAAFEQVKAFLVAALPEVDPRAIYRARPGATPGQFGGVSVVMLPLTPTPAYVSPFGAESDSKQQQRWTVRVLQAAAGDWTMTVLGQTTPVVVAGPGDSAATIAAGLRAAVDGLGVAVTTAVLASPPAAFSVLGDVAGQSLGVSVSAPAGGTYSLAVVDDNVRRAVYNWGVWRVRLIFRDAPVTASAPVAPGTYDAARLCERVRLWLQATSLPATNGLAYPYRRDQLQAAPARLSWLSTSDSINFDEVENNYWVRVAAIDVSFQTPVAMTHDVPSLDAMGLATLGIVTP